MIKITIDCEERIELVMKQPAVATITIKHTRIKDIKDVPVIC